MLATEQQGYLYLNDASAWPGFFLQDLVVSKSGAFELTSTGGVFSSAGVFRSGPISALSGPTGWFRVEALGNIPSGSHLQLFTFTADAGPPPFNPALEMPFPGWTAAPRDALQAIVANSPAHDFWVGGIVRGDGTATPAISQIRVEYGPDTFLKYLPALYRKDPASRSVLERFLSLAQSELGDLGLEIGDLPLLFDPAAAPAGGFPSWLTWLSGWLAWIVNHNWSEKQAREYLAGAFSLYGWRGTPSGLRRYLKIYAGVNAHIFEPSQTATLWSLGENSSLGFTTMLAPAEAEGAVLGSTAVLDHSDLQSPGDCFGGALFDDIAYRFCVGIYCAELTRPGALRDARAAIAREKPAHTVCYLCLIEPRMRIGVQSRIGIDAIVGAAPPAILGEQLGFSVLAATDRARTESEVRNG